MAKTLLDAFHMQQLTAYADNALSWQPNEKTADELYQRMVNLAQDVKKLCAALDDEKAMSKQVCETLRNLHDNWERIVDEQDDDGGPLIENLLYWAIEDLGGHVE